MDRIGYKVAINFARLFGVEVEQREINGVMEDVVVIPMRMNGITQSRRQGNKGLFLYGSAYPTDGNYYNQSHYIISAPRNEEQEELKKLGYRPTFIFGNMRCVFATEQKKGKPADLTKIDNVLNNNEDDSF